MFSDFYEKFDFKKTTPEEKKEVVNSTGEYFPEDHSNKIKGMDELAEAVVDNAMKKQDELVNGRRARKGYVWKRCAKCGTWFESYRNTGLYCSDECKEEALRENSSRYYLNRKKKEEEKKSTAVKECRRCENCGKTFTPKHGLQKYCSDKCAKDVIKKKQRERYLYERDTEKTKKAEEPKVAIEEATKSVEMFDYIDTLRVAIDIVQDVKSTDDVKLAIDKVYDTLKKFKNISE